MLVISVQGNFETAKEAILEGSTVGDALEFRLDLMDLTSIATLREYATLPVIFTLRKQSQGGAFKGSEEKRAHTLLKLLELKPDYVDLEYDAHFFDQIDPDIQIISSYHNFERTPENLQEILERMERFPAAIYKIATLARSSLDALRMLLFVQQRKNVAGMCMGDLGGITRILAPIVNNPLTYTFVGKNTAPGQLSMTELLDIYHYLDLSPSTEIYGVLGDPIDKSIGHLYHNRMFRKVKKDGVYVKIALKPLEVPEFFHLIKELPFVGLSVTMPLKEIVAPYLDGIDGLAKQMGAINTLVKKGKEWLGTNTDGKGALDALEKRGQVKEKTLLIIGAGGAAKAISTEGMNRGAHVIITNRTPEKAENLAAQVGGKSIPIDQINQCLCDIIINTTPVGMSPKSGDIPIPLECIRPYSLGFDVIMSPKETTFLKAVKNKGGQVVYGYEMYEQQALRQLQIWSIAIPKQIQKSILFDSSSQESEFELI